MLFENPEHIITTAKHHFKFSRRLQQHVFSVWSSGPCIFCSSELCSGAVLQFFNACKSLTCIGGELACLTVEAKRDRKRPGHSCGLNIQTSHQSLLTWLCDGLPDIPAAVITGGKTTLTLSCWHHQGLWTVCVCGWVCECAFIVKFFNNQTVFLSLSPNTEAFAWCAPKAFTCRVSNKLGPTLGFLPRLRTPTHTSLTTLCLLNPDLPSLRLKKEAVDYNV